MLPAGFCIICRGSCGVTTTIHVASLSCSSVASGGRGMPCICICICIACICHCPLTSFSSTSIPYSRIRSATSLKYPS
jgi:hypothetical protein